MFARGCKEGLVLALGWLTLIWRGWILRDLSAYAIFVILLIYTVIDFLDFGRPTPLQFACENLLSWVRARHPEDFAEGGKGYTCWHHIAIWEALKS